MFTLIVFSNIFYPYFLKFSEEIILCILFDVFYVSHYYKVAINILSITVSLIPITTKNQNEDFIPFD